MEKAYLVFKDNQGKIVKSSQRNASNLESRNDSLLFQMRWINDLIWMNENRIVLSGNSLNLALVDSDFKIAQMKTIYKRWDSIGFVYRLVRPNLLKSKDSLFYATDIYPYFKDLLSEEMHYKFQFTNDSIQLSGFNIISNLENQSKQIIYCDGSFRANKIYYSVAREEILEPSEKSARPSSFYVTKIENDSEVWHIKLGGDYHFVPTDILETTNGNLIVIGGIYDYFNNGYQQGFWVYIDPDGNIINASTDIRKQDVQLYPNPNKGQFVIESENQIEEIQIYNTQGQLLEIFKGSKSETMDVNMSRYASGMYHLKIVSDKRVVAKTVSIVR